MQLFRNKWVLYAMTVALGIAIISVVFISHNPEKKEHEVNFTVVYKTINSSTEPGMLLGYELHYEGEESDAHGYGPYAKLSAIVKGIDPYKENYKGYCRDIIADIAHTVADKEIIVTIYDDYPSYNLAKQWDDEYKVISVAEEDSVCSHLVARYERGHDDFETSLWYINYYPDAENSPLQDKEIFKANN